MPWGQQLAGSHMIQGCHEVEPVCELELCVCMTQALHDMYHKPWTVHGRLDTGDGF